MSTKMTEKDWVAALEVFRASLPRRGDKGYASKANRQAARKRGIIPVIPHKANEKQKPGFFAKAIYRGRARIEQAVGKLKAGATVADIGCGHGHSTVLMAEAYPNSRFHGFDAHDGSLAAARDNAQEAGVADRVSFENAHAKTYPAMGYDLICFFDCLHDMGDPVGAAKHAAEALAEDGTVMLVEPFASDKVEENLNPVGRLYYAASTTICCAHSLSEETGLALGAQAGEGRLSEVFRNAGFGSFRRAMETPFNLILEARP